MKPFDEIVDENNVSSLLKESQKYLAHTPDETLSDHMSLVAHYFLQLVNSHGLELLIDGLLLRISSNDEAIASLAKKLFWETILYHDFGKVNENFQRMKMENLINFHENKSNGIDSQHSILSAYIFLIHKLTEGIKLSQQKVIITLIAALSHNIIRHHSSKLDDLSNSATFERFTVDLCTKLENYLKCYNLSYSTDLVKQLARAIKNIEFQNLGFEWFALIRLNFSLLTAADYYATSHYCNQWEKHYDEFGILSSEQKKKHFLNLQHTKIHNELLYQRYEEFVRFPLEKLQSKTNVNLNQLRSKMAAEVITNVRHNTSKRLFYIEAPTGGGKTNMAFVASMELMQANPELNKVFYVFPFTTLATQTREAAEETLGIEPDENIELHSRAAWKQKEALKDGLYGEERLDDIHNQFVNYPYTFMSHVRFFDILKTNDKSSIYLMHRLANSVVIIDEVQAYNPELWDKIAYLLKEYSQALNIRFIVMSATLPKIGGLVEADFCYLLPNAIERFFVNPNFAGRVSFSNELLTRKRPQKEDREDYIDWLVQAIYKRSEDYKQSNGNVRTIVEFIFKKSVSEFTEKAQQVFDGYTIYVLSGTILEPRRKQVITELKNKASHNRNILLITTQVVEAGVDIDMDLGFKNLSIIDSEEQLAGRVNRNVNKEGCIVYLFDLDDASVIYGKDRRYKETKSSFEKYYFEILKTKRFDIIYEQIKEWLIITNKEKGLKGTERDYRENLIGKLNFPEIDKEFTLIEHSNISVFVPIELPITITYEDGQKTAIFILQQLQFLEDFGIKSKNDMISGVDVFELYRELVNDKIEGFIERRRNLKMLQSIMAMFTFSLFSESKVVTQLIEGGNREEYGYLYLVTHKEIYSYEMGLLDKNIKDLIFL